MVRIEKVEKVFAYNIIDYMESLRKFIFKLFRRNKQVYNLQYTNKIYTFTAAATIKIVKENIILKPIPLVRDT